MSGSGSGGSGWSSGGGSGEVCQEHYQNLIVVSPVPAVVNEITRGSQLSFEVVDAGNSKSLRVKFGDDFLGSIISGAQAIIICIEKGINYVGIVTSVNGGQCLIEARKVNP